MMVMWVWGTAGKLDDRTDLQAACNPGAAAAAATAGHVIC